MDGYALKTFDEDVPEDKILRLLNAGYERARKIIAENEIRCRRLAARLQEHGRVSADEFWHLMSI
jgi:hypothetical protein